ncbi:hypothetical protein HQ560_15085 [bacterium]|nr:hypothetical protein [bacterium]
MDKEAVEKSRIAGPVHGVGLDNEDGHVRITKMDNFRLMGGSRDTHEQMQETAIKFNERLKKHDKQVTDLNVRQFVELAGEVGMFKPPDAASDGE